jgi:acyl carrier protein
MQSLTRSEIREQIVKYLCESFPLFNSAVPDDTPMAEHGVDSLGTTNIVLHLEEYFKIQINDAEITRANLGSVESLVGFISKKQNV